MSDPVFEARALLAAATPGPWLVSDFDGIAPRIVGPDRHVATVLDDGDAALIAAAPGLLARLCDEVERLRAEVARPIVLHVAPGGAASIRRALDTDPDKGVP